MPESARKHGPFDGRYPVRPRLPAPRWDLRPDGDGGESLDWAAFLARFFPNRGRHDFVALKAYEVYRHTLVGETPQQRSAPRRLLLDRRAGHSRPAGVGGRVPVAALSTEVLIWESEGGGTGRFVVP
jgi:hypothetical protein